MGYYMRFVITDEKDISLDTIDSALKEIDPAYSVDFDDNEGELLYHEDVYGVFEINRPGDGLFDEEIGELKEFVQDSEGDRRSEVLQVLDNAKSIIALQVLQQGRATTEETFVRIDPLWEWLFRNFRGLMQADGEGYYDAQGMVLKVDLSSCLSRLAAEPREFIRDLSARRSLAAWRAAEPQGVLVF